MCLLIDIAAIVAVAFGRQADKKACLCKKRNFRHQRSTNHARRLPRIEKTGAIMSQRDFSNTLGEGISQADIHIGTL